MCIKNIYTYIYFLVYALMVECWHEQSVRRPTFAEIVHRLKLWYQSQRRRKYIILLQTEVPWICFFIEEPSSQIFKIF